MASDFSALTSATVGLSEPRFDGETLYWLESRPEEKGRTTIVCLQPGTKQPQTLLPKPINVRSKVNEYGGGSYCVGDGVIYFVLADDQRIYRLDSKAKKIEPQAITPEGAWRYANLVIDNKRQRLLAVCEDHSNSARKKEPETYVVSISLNIDSSKLAAPQKLISGADFYSSLAISADGQRLCWLSWNHPNMPWDNNQCWVADFNNDGDVINPTLIAGSLDHGSDTEQEKSGESIFQPQWSNDGSLYYVSDRNNWWNICRHQVSRNGFSPAENVLEKNVEFATPQWVFGLSTYDFVDEHTILCCYSERGCWSLGLIDIDAGTMTTLVTNLTDIGHVHCNRTESKQAVFLGAAAATLNNLYQLNLSDISANNFRNQTPELIAQSSATHWNAEFISVPQSIEFPVSINSESNKTAKAFAFFYPPQNPDFCGPNNEKPPLIVLCHGGPTSATHCSLNLKIQFWTSRGFAVADINYRGSTGYGREYRQQLNGQWGVADVEDAAAAVLYLAQQNKIDAKKAAIKGSSAGGYTVLVALTFTDVFKAGASYYGIGDLETLAQDTHKFESRYMDTLVGPYPQQKSLYQQRSPINSIDQLNCPVIFLQGLEDKVVPPNQAQAMVKALNEKHIPVAYVEFPEEGHGFRQAENIQRAIEAELYFYSKVFGFPLSDKIQPVAINNLT